MAYLAPHTIPTQPTQVQSQPTQIKNQLVNKPTATVQPPNYSGGRLAPQQTSVQPSQTLNKIIQSPNTAVASDKNTNYVGRVAPVQVKQQLTNVKSIDSIVSRSNPTQQSHATIGIAYRAPTSAPAQIQSIARNTPSDLLKSTSSATRQLFRRI